MIYIPCTLILKELKKMSDISFEFEELKTGRTVTSLKFYIRANKTKVSSKPLLLPNNVANEVCATTEYKNTNEEEKCSTGLISVVKSIFKEDITGLQAKTLLATAKGDINLIKEKYKYSETAPKIDNIVGWVINAIKKDYQPPKSKVKTGDFNNYEQRTYDFDELEKKLLGWDNSETDEATGNEYQQLSIRDKE
jgi:plasmid replication initiation protein